MILKNKYFNNVMCSKSNFFFGTSSLIAFSLALATPIFAKESTLYNIKLKEQSLNNALLEISNQTGIVILDSGSLTDNQVVEPLFRKLSAPQILHKLFSGTGLTYRKSSDGTYVVQSDARYQKIEFTSENEYLKNLPSMEDDSHGSDTSNLETIIVTANRYETRIQDVPTSIDLISREEIQKKGISRLSDALKLIPNVFVYDDGGSYNSAIAIRGIGNEIPFTEPAVSIFIDGVPYSGNMSDFDLHNVQRIEVMRGAQSTLYGQNTLAGAVNVVTENANTKEWGGQVSGKIGNRKHLEIMGDLSGAIVEDKIGLSLSFGKTHGDGYITNTTTKNSEVGGYNNTRFRTVIDVTASDNFFASLTFDYNKEKGAKIDAVKRETYSFARMKNPKEERTSKQGALSLSWFKDNIEISSITGIRGVDLTFFDNMVQIFGTDTDNSLKTKERVLFQEFRVVYPKGDGEFGWQAGVYISNKTFEIDQAFAIPIFVMTQNFKHKQKTNRAEFYGRLDYEFLEDLTVSAGGRFSRVKREVSQEYGINTFTLFKTTKDIEKTFDNGVGKLALSYNFNENTTVYSSFSKGYKPGTARSGATKLSDLFLPSEKSDTFELGAKGIFDRVRYNATIFHTKYKNRHTFYNNAISSPITIAIPDAVSKGAEFNISFDVMEEWNLFVKAGYLKTSFGSFILPNTNINVKNNAFRDAPEWNFALGSSYSTEITPDWNLFINGDVIFQAKTQGNIAAREISENPSYAIVNMAFGFERNNLDISVQVRNLLNKFYYTTTAMNNGTGAPGAPRSIFLNVSYKF